jgi:FMN phosphatase YigB (HAD superfamily)
MGFNIKNNYGPNIEVNAGGKVTLVQDKNGMWHTVDAEEADYEEIKEDGTLQPAPTEEQRIDNPQERNEERFHFVHPEIEDEEAWRIHQAIKRLVAYQKIPEICAYLKELKQKGKVLLPSVSAVMYKELVRLGMPTGDGYSEKHFSNSYTK